MGFIEEIAPYIQKYAPQYGIKVCSPIIAQAVLESASGTSELAKNANNFFGLKYRANRCPSSNGKYQKVAYEQKSDGSYVSTMTDWFKFPNMESGVKGYFDFINISNYANLKGVTDPRRYLELIKQDKYATSLNYVEKVYAVINQYGLTKYDTIANQTSLSNITSTSSTTSNKAINVKIAIDAGHGAETGGKRTPDGYREHWANAKVASYFAKAMDRCGVQYIKVAWNDENGKDDVDVPLSTRQAQIKAAKCDYSISFHFNASGDGKSYNSGEGVETLYSNSSFGDSRNMATFIQNEMIKGTSQKNRGVKQQSLAMCNCSALGTKAAVLVECAFMTNLRESQLMKSEEFCLECAEDAARGFCAYIGIPYVAGGKISTSSTTSAPTTPSSTQSSGVPYIVKVTDPALNIRKGPGTNYAINGVIRDFGKYTIVEVQGNWGRLKSGVGWISLKYTTRC